MTSQIQKISRVFRPTTMKHTHLAVIGSAAWLWAGLAAHGALVLHWKLDEADGDYTGGGYREEVHANTTVSKEVALGTDITEGQTGLAPGGGTSMSFSDTVTDNYINAGSVENTGTYVSGAATVPLVLGSNLTMTAWFNADVLSGDRVILSNQFGSGGFMFGPTGTNIFMDFGNTRASYAAELSVGQDYFVAVQMDLNGDTNFGWTAGANHRISLYNPTTATWQHFDGTQAKTGMDLQNLSIGRFTNGGREFDGLIDDVRVYNHTLSQSDLNSLVIPEPGSAVLLGLTAGLGLLRRKRGWCPAAESFNSESQRPEGDNPLFPS